MSVVALGLVLLAPGAVLLVPGSGAGQTPGRLPRVGVVCADFCGAFSGGERFPEGRAFKESLSQLGWVDGRTVVIDDRGAGVMGEALTRAVAHFVQQKVAVLVADGLVALEATRKATRTIPIVMLNVPDAIERGLVDSLARPGGNITGLTTPLAELATKQLELLGEAVPRLTRVAVLSNPANPEHLRARDALKVAGRLKGLELHFLEARSRTHDEMEAVFSAMAQARAGALLVLRDPELYGGNVSLFAVKHRLPAISTDFTFVQAGGLMAFGPDRFEMVRGAAGYVAKILGGRRPAELPVERPTRFELAIHLSTAKAIGLAIPESVRLRADHLLE